MNNNKFLYGKDDLVINWGPIVLKVLSIQPNQEIYQNKLRKMININSGTLSRTLENLKELGLIEHFSQKGKNGFVALTLKGKLELKKLHVFFSYSPERSYKDLNEETMEVFRMVYNLKEEDRTSFVNQDEVLLTLLAERAEEIFESDSLTKKEKRTVLYEELKKFIYTHLDQFFLTIKLEELTIREIEQYIGEVLDKLSIEL